MNYVITKLAIARIKDVGLSYETLKSVHGDIELAAAEFKRRLLNPYEDGKIANRSNGDVYDGLR